MDIIDIMLQFRKEQNVDLLLHSDIEIDRENLNVIVINILDWLKLEYKRQKWIAEGKKTCLKPLKLNKKYNWCKDINLLIESERNFSDIFQVKDGNFEFSDYIGEDNRKKIRQKAYEFYDPVINLHYRSDI